MDSWRTITRPRLIALKARIDAIHDTVIHALRRNDEATVDRALAQQREVVVEYTALLTKRNLAET
jgi:hypothetical protein